jgi:hypothetical protein
MGLAESEHIPVDLIEKPSIAVPFYSEFESEAFLAARSIWLTCIELLSYVSPATTDILYQSTCIRELETAKKHEYDSCVFLGDKVWVLKAVHHL